MGVPVVRVTRARGRALLLVLALLSGPPLLLGPSASAGLSPRTQTPEEKAARLAEDEAAGDLEDSSAAVKAAAVALRAISGQLPAARASVERARGELIGARSKARAAEDAVVRAERALRQARAETTAAGARVDEGRADVGRLARRTYQRGALGDLRDVIDADRPQDVVVRAGLLRSVFRSQNDTLSRLSADRLELARARAETAAEERALSRARDRARDDAARARAVAVRAEQAAARVADLVSRRTAVLRSAEADRAQDLRDYEAAQRASRELAERIREAARKAAAAAAAEERRRKAAEAAAAAAAKRRGQTPPRPAGPTRTSRRSGDMLWPAPGRLTSRYGYRTHPIYGDRRFHAGIDVGGGLGARVSASDGGVVTYAGYANGYGTLVVVSHGVVDGRDLSTAYAHMGQIAVSEGQRVGRGDKVGEIGNEGNSTGPHLHFEVRRDGDPVDPLDYVSPP